MPSIHATAVAIDGEALLILGPSRAGKSRLAAALIARATRARPIVLVGDDRVVLGWREGVLVARPHPRIAGFIERRGLGIVAMDWVAEAPVGGIVELAPSPACGRSWRGAPDEDACRSSDAGDLGGGSPHPTPLREATFSRSREKDELRHCDRLVLLTPAADPARVLAWWAGRDAEATHLRHSAAAADRPCAKD